MTETPQWLTVKEVAEQLRVSKMTVLREIHQGKLQAMRVGHLMRIRTADFQTYLRENRIGPMAG